MHIFLVQGHTDSLAYLSFFFSFGVFLSFFSFFSLGVFLSFLSFLLFFSVDLSISIPSPSPFAAGVFGSSAISASALAAPDRSGTARRYSAGVLLLGFPCLSSFPSAISFFLSCACGPRPQRLGYVSRSITTRLILATTPWSQVAITAVVIWAIPTATASPLVVMITTSSSTSISDSYR